MESATEILMLVIRRGTVTWVLTYMASSPKATYPSNRQSLMTSNEVMAMLRVNRATLCRYCRDGKIPHIRMPDTSYRSDPDAMQEWLRERTLKA